MFNIKRIWGLLNSPIRQVFKPLPTYETEFEDQSQDGFWEHRDETDYSSRSHSLETLDQKAFFRTPQDFTIKGEADAPLAVMDGFNGTNNVFTIGNSRAGAVQMEWYTNNGYIGPQACVIISQHWLVNRACTMPGEDAIRNGFEVQGCGKELTPDIIQDIRDLDEYFNLNDHMKEYSQMRRVFGIRIMLYDVRSKDKKYYEKPFNIDGITEGSYQGMIQVDPYWITPELDGDAAGNPASPFFYEPTYWRINGKLYHRSHLVINRYAKVADVLKPNYIYGGIPLTQMIYERIYAAERCANEAPELLLTKRLWIIKTNTAKVLQNLGKFLERINIFTSFKNNQGLHVIDKTEEIEKRETTLNDVNEVIEGQYSIVASIAKIPETKLLSKQLKGGIGKTGDGERQMYTDVLEDEQTVLDPVVNRHHLLVMKSHIEPMRKFTGRIMHVWNPVNSPDPKELSEIRKNDAETAGKYVDMAAISPDEVRDKIIKDKNSGYGISQPEEVKEIDYDDFIIPDDDGDGLALPNSDPIPSIPTIVV